MGMVEGMATTVEESPPARGWLQDELHCFFKVLASLIERRALRVGAGQFLDKRDIALGTCI